MVPRGGDLRHDTSQEPAGPHTTTTTAQTHGVVPQDTVFESRRLEPLGDAGGAGSTASSWSGPTMQQGGTAVAIVARIDVGPGTRGAGEGSPQRNVLAACAPRRRPHGPEAGASSHGSDRHRSRARVKRLSSERGRPRDTGLRTIEHDSPRLPQGTCLPASSSKRPHRPQVAPTSVHAACVRTWGPRAHRRRTGAHYRSGTDGLRVAPPVRTATTAGASRSIWPADVQQTGS